MKIELLTMDEQAQKELVDILKKFHNVVKVETFEYYTPTFPNCYVVEVEVE